MHCTENDDDHDDYCDDDDDDTLATLCLLQYNSLDGNVQSTAARDIRWIVLPRDNLAVYCAFFHRSVICY